MAGTPPEQPWSNHEKNYLLAEIIKNANPPAHVLFEVLRNLNIVQPRWEEIPLPPGRSLNSSRYAFEDLRRSLQLGTPATPTPLSGPVNLGQKRGFSYEAGSYSAGAPSGGGREIRPKLPPSSAPTLYAQPASTEPPPKRKRGRPTKAEALEKAGRIGISGHVGGPGPTSGPRSVVQAPSQPSESTPVPRSSTEEVKPAFPPTTTMAIAAMLTPTAREPKSASHSHSSSSSGRRRRARSTKSEHEDSPATRGSTARQDYDSPYARSGPRPDTPARAAVLRHREDPTGLPRATPSTGPPADPSGQSGDMT